MVMTAPVSIPRCPRCLKPILKRARVEVIGHDKSGRPLYAHFGCEKYGEVAAESVPQERPPEAALERVKDEIKATIESRLQIMVANAYSAIGPKATEKVISESRQAASDYLAGFTESFRDQLQTDLGEDRAAFQKEMRETVQRLLKPHQRVITVIQNGDKEWRAENEVFHSVFPEVLKLAAAGFNVFLPGPTGCGKTHLAMQTARALGLDFAMISGSAGTTETEIFGTSIPNIATGENVYIETEFIRVFENGGLFLLDEGDALDSNCFLKLNAALANGFCSVPRRTARPVAKRHKNFIFFMAANTWGTGASRLYCGRNRLDEATLDRFRASCVPMDYCPEVEQKYACPDPVLYQTFLGWREKIYAARMQRILSTRFMRDAYILIKDLDYTVDQVAKKLAGGWSEQETVAVFGKNL